jgi:very-short-patch-repair endonuclease
MAFEPQKKLLPLARALRKQDTWAEKLLWRWLRDRRFSAYKFRRQHQFGKYILDFFCLEASLNIELDGSQHGFPGQSKKDEVRDAWLEKAGVKVLRFWNARLRREKEVVRETIWRELQVRASHPLPDYCRPMDPAVNQDAKENFMSRSPSPSGRGGNVHSLTRNPAAGLNKPHNWKGGAA